MKIQLDENERAFLLSEYPPLRDEVNRTIDRMTANELACSAFVFSVIFFQLTSPSNLSLPVWIVMPMAAALAVSVAFIGHQRSKVFRRHLDQVDEYLFTVECRIGEGSGWTHYYRETMAKKDVARQAGSRTILWHVLKYIAFLNFVLQIVLVSPIAKN